MLEPDRPVEERKPDLTRFRVGQIVRFKDGNEARIVREDGEGMWLGEYTKKDQFVATCDGTLGSLSISSLVMGAEIVLEPSETR